MEGRSAKMELLYRNGDTIAAIATPMGTGAIAMVRISGDRSWEIVRRLTGIEDPKPRRAYRAVLKDENGEIDEVVVIFYKSPRSYTGEDMVEITCHGGYVVTNMVLKAVLSAGARMAEPGEFTKRAFLNGKIDLTRSEAVRDLVEAKTESEVRAIVKNLMGNLFEYVEKVRNEIIGILSEIEVELDYPDEIEVSGADLERKILGVLKNLKEISERSEKSIKAVHGVRTVIVGKPNVGKSTLLNRLLKEDRAIVTSIPGTTRDVIEGDLNIEGYHFRIIDTAGLRKTNDVVEKLGVERTLKEIERSDLILFVVDVTNLNDEDEHVYEMLKGGKVVLVMNKSDILEPKRPPEWYDGDWVSISAIDGRGLRDLEKIMVGSLKDIFSSLKAKVLITSERQRGLIIGALKDVQSSLESLRDGFPSDVISLELQRALEKLDEMIGKNFREDLLDTIFSTFCVGK